MASQVIFLAMLATGSHENAFDGAGEFYASSYCDGYANQTDSLSPEISKPLFKKRWHCN